jgi:hypothetical protein
MKKDYLKQDHELQIKQNDKIDRLTWAFLILSIIGIIVDYFK